MSRVRLSLGIIAAILACGSVAPGQDTSAARAPSPSSESLEQPTVPVVVDGVELFRVRGVSGLSAEIRAGRIAKAIRDAGSDTSLSADLSLQPTPVVTWIASGTHRLFGVVDADAQIEGVDRAVLAEVFRQRAQEAVVRYRTDREAGFLWRRAGHALLATVAFLLALSL